MEMPELADENIFDILSRLPVKSLMRFKCVSKPWRSLISDPQFIKAHFSRLDQMRTKMLVSSPSHASIMDYEDFENSVVELNYPIAIQSQDWVEFVGSCNGLVCLLLYSCTFILWNPSTREFRQLPPLTPSSDIYDTVTDHLFEGKDCVHFEGFGYDSSIDDYKIIIGFWPKRPAANICPGGCVVQCFSLKSNEWKFIGSYKVGYDFEPCSGISLNGNLHWISDDRYGKRPVVLSFNIKDEKFMEVVPLPADCYSRSYQLRLSAFDNSLFLCTIYKNGYDDSDHYIRVWEKNGDAVEFEDCWKKLYLVKYQLARTPTNCQLYFTKKHKLVLGVLKDTIRIYDLEAVTCKAFQSDHARFLNVIVYRETLVSPN